MFNTSSTPALLRVGLLGFGLSGATFHAPLIAVSEDFELAAIVTSNPQRQAQAQQLYPRARLFDDVEEFFAQATSLDLVVVCVTNHFHYEYALRLIKAGVPVIVEKPLAATADQAADLVRTAGAAQVFLTCFQNRRFDGDFMTLAPLIDSGVLGEVVRFESRFDSPSLDVKAGWRDDPAPGVGGVLLDLGAHLVDQAFCLFGEVESVYAEADVRRPNAHANDDTMISLRFSSGVVAHLGMSKIQAGEAPRFQVVGTSGTYTKWGLDPQEAQLRAGALPGDAGFGVAEQRSEVVTRTGVAQVPLVAGDYQLFYAGVAAALRGSDGAAVAANDSVYALRVLEAALQSAAEGCAVEVPPYPGL